MVDEHESTEPEPIPLAELVAAVDGLDPADPDWADLHWYVADEHHDRYLQNGEPDDLDEAIRRGRLVVAAQGEKSAPHLHDLALMLWDRIEETQGADDLQEYIRLLEASLALLAEDDSDAELKAKSQANLATGLVSRNRYGASEQDIERATGLWEAALTSELLDTGVQAGIAANIAQALSRDGASESDLRRAVYYGRRSVQSPIDDPEEIAQNEFALATALASLHSLVEDDGLLEEAIVNARRGLDHLNSDDPDAPGFTANLIGLLRQQARETGEAAPLTEAVRLALRIVNQIADTDRDRVLILSTAAAAMSEAANQSDDMTLLREALELYRQAIFVAPDSSHEQGVALFNLASVCRDGNERLDAPELIEEGIDAGSRALGIFEQPGLYRAAALTATANCLRDRFVLAGLLADLDQALGYAEDALAFTPERHPERAARLTNLAVLLSDDFAERADRAQLDRAILLYRSALDASERVGVRIPERLNDLALALRDRNKDAGHADDLREAVELAESALGASKPGQLTWAGYANNLGNALAERYELDGDVDDLDRAISLFEQALADATGRGFESSGYATNLGLALATRARVTGLMADMDQALLNLARSIDLLPSEHPDRAHRASNLADAYRQRSIMMDNVGHTSLAEADAIAAVATAEDAVMFAGTSDARLLPALSNLAEALRWQRDLVPGSDVGSRILAVQRRAATLEQITPAEKFGQAGRWAHDAELIGAGGEALQAYEHAVAQTTEVAWIGLSLAERLGLLREMNEVLGRAVACAAAAEQPWTALAWADHVRSVLWRQGIQATTLSAQRNDAQLAGLSGLQRGLPVDRPEADRGRREQIRQWAHAEREALRVTIASPDRYKALTFSGVVILLIPGTEASSALLLRAHDDPQQVRLPLAPAEQLSTHVEALRQASAVFLAADGANPNEELKARHAIFDCLDWLWDAIAEPVLSEIAPEPGERPQLWWSPVGDFALLPVHAAGRHPRKSVQLANKKAAKARTVPDQASSSYLPTILGSRSGQARTTRADGHLLYVSANDASGSLTHLEKEREIVGAALRQVPIDDLVDHDATVARLREAIPACSFLHIAAHGAIGTDDFLDAGFQLSDGRFTLRDLAGCNADHGKLAMLLTCESATGDTQSPDEALHVAGAAHQAGFPDVIAATLPVRDASSLPVVSAVYRMLDESADLVFESVPAALDVAVQALRLDPETGPDPLSWVPYAHFRAGLAPG